MPLTTFRNVTPAYVVRFRELDKPCKYWGDGLHIIATETGLCRCGLTFKIVEVLEEEPNADSTQS